MYNTFFENLLSGGHDIGFDRYRKLLQYVENNLMLGLFQKVIGISVSAWEMLANPTQHTAELLNSCQQVIESCLESVWYIVRFPYMLTLREFQSESYLSRLDDICAIMLPDQFQDQFDLGHPFFEYLLALVANPDRFSPEVLCKTLRILAYIPALRKSSMRNPPLPRTSAFYCLRLIASMTKLANRILEEKSSGRGRQSFSNPEVRETLRGAILDSVNRVATIYTVDSLIENIGPILKVGGARDFPAEFLHANSESQNSKPYFGFAVMIKGNILDALSACWELVWFERITEGAGIQEFCQEYCTSIVETWRQINLITGHLSMHVNNRHGLREYISSNQLMQGFVDRFLNKERSVSNFFDLCQAVVCLVHHTQFSATAEASQLSDYGLKKISEEIQDLCFSFLSLINYSEMCSLATHLLPALWKIATMAQSKLSLSTATEQSRIYFSNSILLLSVYLAHIIKQFRERDPSHSGIPEFYESFVDVSRTMSSVANQPPRIAPDFMIQHSTNVSPFSVEVMPEESVEIELEKEPEQVMSQFQCETQLAQLVRLVLGSDGKVSRQLGFGVTNTSQALDPAELGWLLVWGQITRTLEGKWVMSQDPACQRIAILECWGGSSVELIVRVGIQESLSLMSRPGQSQVGVILAGACLQNLALVVKGKVPRAIWRQSELFTTLMEQIRSLISQGINFELESHEDVFRVRSECYSLLAILVLNDRHEEFLQDAKSVAKLMFDIGDMLTSQIQVEIPRDLPGTRACEGHSNQNDLEDEPLRDDSSA